MNYYSRKWCATGSHYYYYTTVDAIDEAINCSIHGADAGLYFVLIHLGGIFE